LVWSGSERQEWYGKVRCGVVRMGVERQERCGADGCGEVR